MVTRSRISDFISEKMHGGAWSSKAGNGLLAPGGIFSYSSFMELAATDNRISRKEYLEGELSSKIRHEYVAGYVYAMSGGTLGHQRVAGNFLRIAGNQLLGKLCFPTGSDFKLNVQLIDGSEAFYYPDAMLICAQVGVDALFTDSPSVILEVLSPSTRRDDQTLKLRDYLTIPSLRAYILAEAETPLLTVYRRGGDGFHREMISGLDTALELPEVGVRIPLKELYLDALN